MDDGEVAGGDGGVCFGDADGGEGLVVPVEDDVAGGGVGGEEGAGLEGVDGGARAGHGRTSVGMWGQRA